MSKTSAQGSFRFPFWLTCYPKSGNRHRFRLRIPRNVPLCRRPDPALAGLSPVMPCRKRVQKKKLARRTIRILPVRPPGHALPRLSFSDNSIIARQERAIKVTLGYFGIPFWITCYPKSGNRCRFHLRVPRNVPLCRRFSPPSQSGFGRTATRHARQKRVQKRKRMRRRFESSRFALPATPSRAFPFLTILS